LEWEFECDLVGLYEVMASHLFFSSVVDGNSFMNIGFFVILKFFWDIWFENQFGLYLFQVGSSVGELRDTEI